MIAVAVAHSMEAMTATADKTHAEAMMQHMGIKHERLMAEFLKMMVGGVCETYELEPTDEAISAVLGAFRVGYSMAEGMAEAKATVEKGRAAAASRTGAPRVRPRRGR